MTDRTEHPHLYRFGFLVASGPSSVTCQPNEHWRQEVHGNLTLLLHKEVEVHLLEEPSGSALLLGWAFPIGESSLDAILRRLISAADHDVLTELDQLSGRFCLVLRNQSGTRIYSDPSGSRTIFYSPSDPTCFASHAELLATHLGIPLSKRAAAFVATAKYQGLSVKYLPGDVTMYEGVHHLVPNHALRLGRSSPERIWPQRPRHTRSLDEFFERCDTYFAAIARGFSKRSVFLGITGGIDTRLLMAGIAAHDVDLRGMTWLGGYHDVRERPIIEVIVNRMKIENRYIEIPGPRDHVGTIAGRNGGNARGASRLTSAIKAALPSDGNAIFARGYGGEIMRGFYSLHKQPMRNSTPEEMFLVYAGKSTVKKRDSVFDEFAMGAFRTFAKRVNYDETFEAFRYDINDIFYWEQRTGSWSAGMHNEMDPAMFSITGLNDRVMFEVALGLSPTLRLTRSLFNSYIKRVEPRLGDLPTA